MSSSLKYTCLTVFFILYLCPANLFACSCVDCKIPICKNFADADAVFIGKVEKITAIIDGEDSGLVMELLPQTKDDLPEIKEVFVHFKVEKNYKGAADSTIKVSTNRGTSCDFFIIPDNKWIVFAYQNSSTNYLSFGVYDGSDPFASSTALETIKEIENLSQGKLKLSITGRLAKSRYDGELEGIKVYLTGNKLKLFKQTGKNGFYTFDDIPPGKYKIKIILPFRGIDQDITNPNIIRKLSKNKTTFEYIADIKTSGCNYRYFEIYDLNSDS